MNKNAFQKNIGKHVKIRPIAKRFWGEHGPQLPPVDDDWSIQGNEKERVTIENLSTGHGKVLARDQIHNWMEDPERGERYGILRLNVQVNIGGNRMWTEPTFRPGEALPDQFGNVRGWRRENDLAYVQSLFPKTHPASVPPPVSIESPAMRFGLFVCLCVGVGLLLANV